MRRIEGIMWLLIALLALVLLPGRLAANSGAQAVGKLVAVQGQVSVRPSGSNQWRRAQVNEPLYVGDAVRTGPNCRAAILCVDESQIKLNENTIVILKNIAPSPRLQPVAPAGVGPPPASQYEVPEGEIWIRNKHEKFRFELETPAVTAIIRGTELNIKVQRNGTTSVILLEGQVCINNPQGEVCLRPGEEGYAIPGQRPAKRMLVQPEDAVQWVLYYPGTISYRDLPLTPLPGEFRTPPGPPAAASLIREGEEAYDRGRLPEAREKAMTVLAMDKDNSRALTILGWVSLREYKAGEALQQFRRVRQPDDLTILGLALAREELGDAAGAYEFIKAARRQGTASPVLAAMSGYFALLAGKVDEAKSILEAALALPAPAPQISGPLLAQIDVVQNRKEAALAKASQALTRSPDSPMTLFSLGLVKMASFDLPAATQYYKKALEADPQFVAAYVYLAKIYLGSEYLGRAQKTIGQALQIAPQDPQVLSLAGFVRLAYRDYSGAFDLWNRALRADPRFGEPHLGLGIYQFRYREFRQGLEEMLTATLIDPRVASYQTELGKALYQTRSFDRALEVYDYAKTLDPKDPTPYFYKGIALTDLNRPGEAVQEINKSIALNDNVAMFRSRSLLDQDLAVRNASLARSYQQLGLNEWGFSKAITAVKNNPYDSSSHLFLRDLILSARAGSESPFTTGGLLLSTANVEAALFRVLSRANQNTYSSVQPEGTQALGLTNDYTSMFEMPYGRVIAVGGIGAWEGKKSIQDHLGFAYGGTPGLAALGFGRYFDSRGANFDSAPTPPTNSLGGSQRNYDVQADLKWEPTIHGTLSGFFESIGQRLTASTGKLYNSPFTIGPVNEGDNLDANARQNFYELAYYHRFNPDAALLGYYARLQYPFHAVANNNLSYNLDLGLGPPGFPTNERDISSLTFDRASNNVQLQQHLRLSMLGQHSLIGGFDYLTGPGISQRRNITQMGVIDTSALVPFGFPAVSEFTTPLLLSDSHSPQWNYSFYLLDYWRPTSNLVLELGLFKDFNKAVRFNNGPEAGFQENIYNSSWSPRFGANYLFNIDGTQHALRGVVGRCLNTHFITQPLLVPSETAGFPWTIDSDPGAEIRQAGAAWETQWNPKTFTVLRFNALRVATPTFFLDGQGFEQPMWQTWKRYQTSFVLNRILFSSLGLSAGVMGKRVIPDLSYWGSDGLQSFSELDVFVGLAYLHPQGWLARLRPLLAEQFGKVPGHHANTPFVIANLTLGREFPNKRGFATFEVQNLFNRRPFYALEPVRDLEFSNQRRYLFRLGLYF